MKGHVTSFLAEKGYGFIRGDDGEDYFVHRDDVSGPRDLVKRQRVRFETTATPKGLRARSVVPGPMPVPMPEYSDRFISTERVEVRGFVIARYVMQNCWYEARNPHQAKEGLNHHARMLGANAVIGRRLHKYSKRQFFLSSYRYTMHRFYGHAVILQKRR